MSRPKGFTLVEVLIALAVIGVGLLATLKVTQQSGLDLQAVERRTLAGLSAENAMISIMLNPAALAAASSGSHDCPQATLPLRCRFVTHATRHAQFRRIEIFVEDSAGHVVANRFGVVRVRPR